MMFGVWVVVVLGVCGVRFVYWDVAWLAAWDLLGLAACLNGGGRAMVGICQARTQRAHQWAVAMGTMSGHRTHLRAVVRSHGASWGRR